MICNSGRSFLSCTYIISHTQWPIRRTCIIWPIPSRGHRGSLSDEVTGPRGWLTDLICFLETLGASNTLGAVLRTASGNSHFDTSAMQVIVGRA